MNERKKIAIACQGGGSHTAFTAGVLKRLLERGVHEHFNIVGLSGTSGGAICATAVWYGLLKLAQGASEKPDHWLVKFWEDNSAILPWEKYLNSLTVATVRLQDRGMIPALAANPYSTQWFVDWLETISPRPEYLDFKMLLENHIDFAQFEQLVVPSSPRLLLGAVDVLSGEFKTFDSDKGEITVEAIMASASIPTIFRAIRIGNGAYWDGLFSENPPVSGLIQTTVEERPEEIWIVQINPKTCDEEPSTAQSIIDRRNELAGNLSLFQEVRFLEAVNKWLDQGYLNPEYAGLFKKISIRWISMDNQFANSLDYASKLERSREFITELMEHGRVRADAFLYNLEHTPILVSMPS
ncbi:MAG: patatin-like phospholipase family protein [Hydrococcus sp. C42_A2020_068]|uniref:patatin-like phospholipase family protein n=1 Tax=Pleurocapsa sp. PCC 7327 TaxID=118163 RepID=UPI00029F9DC5|nr:patatin-like phospholipase family protein [Pleurocapsa sp. PCC 7327]AFY75838.1 putative esterase of the alpha-beta hydrolase superfamily [Pleurocapsa sp. PCC 7327]MBF2020385.1 patatin-like phospholipase family protein [Hydrococcus sp. C42_A2020_068]